MLIPHILKTFKNLETNSLSSDRSKKSSRLNKDKILLVGMADSPHFQKWLRILQTEFPEKKFLVFPSDRPRLTKAKLNELKQFKKSIRIFKLFPIEKLNFISYYVLDIVFGHKWRAYFLARFILMHKPAINHFHEMQHGAYIYNLIVNYRKIPNNSRNIISTWGSDLTLYSWVDEHKHQIQSCLSWANILTAEKEIEIQDAKRLGFKSEFRAPIYITCGENFSSKPHFIKPSTRRLILVKGHQLNTGRALNALFAISQMDKELEGFEVIVYSAPESVQIQVDILRNQNKINIKTLDKVSNSEMRSLFQKARVAISLAVSDGLPGVLVEAMQAGALPIQSENSAADKFLVHGKNGFIVNPWDLNLIRESIRKAITDDTLVDLASELNFKVLKQKYNYDDGISKLRALYL
jgi:glycosyltransferase involved in cell wall biosynthesis